MEKTGRNDTCPCGSGLKYKKCCLPKHIGMAPPPASPDATWLRMRRTEGNLEDHLIDHMLMHYGVDAVADAWDEFSCWEDVPMDHEKYDEIDTVLRPWLLYSWVPEDMDESEDLFEDDDEGEDEDEDEDDDQTPRNPALEQQPKAHFDRPEMTIAEHYLSVMGNRLNAFERRFIQTAVSQPFSYWQVIECVPGASVKLRDLLRGGDTKVHERTASHTLQPGTVIYGRVIAMDGDAIMLGMAPVPMPPNCAQDILDYRQKIAQSGHPDLASSPDMAPKLTTEMLFEYDMELRDYYWEMREIIMNPAPPVMYNTDGEKLIPITLYYELSCSLAEAVEALASLSLAKAKDLLREATFNENGELTEIEFPWLKKGNAQNKAWNNTVMGHIKINDIGMVIDVNSEERATSITRRIAQRLRGRAVLVESEETPIEEMIANKRAGYSPQVNAGMKPTDDEHDALMAMPEIQEQMRRMSEQHWRDWLDTELPALKGQTPRQAAKTQLGRERLEALLTDFEGKLRGDPILDPDIAKLRRELGLD